MIDILTKTKLCHLIEEASIRPRNILMNRYVFLTSKHSNIEHLFNNFLKYWKIFSKIERFFRKDFYENSKIFTNDKKNWKTGAYFDNMHDTEEQI